MSDYKKMVSKLFRTPGSMAAKAGKKKVSKKTKKKVRQFKEGFSGRKSKSKY